MSKEKKNTRPARCIAKGFLAGLVGGAIGAGAKILAEQLFPPRVEGQSAPPVALAEHFVGRRLPEDERRLAMQGIHFVFGALAGAVYGVAVEVEPSLGAWRGAAFGITLNRITHESVLPKLGLAVPARQQPTQQRISEWVTHAAYGVATDTVRRAVRRAL